MRVPWRRPTAARADRRDELTGLHDRRGLLEAVTRAWMTPTGAEGAGALAMLDLDGFKSINDVLGHRAGDEVLRLFALRLRQALPSSVVLARTAGDEFGALFPRHSPAEAAALLEHVRDLVATRPLRVDGTELALAFGAGLTDLRLESVDRVLAGADRALYQAKANGDGRCVLFTGDPEVLPTRGQLHARVTELAAARRRLERLALTDPLTGLANRRALDDALDGLDRGPREGLGYALLFVDIDHFGAYNHVHGDLAGDASLTRVAQALGTSCRDGETVFRKGGEELVVVLAGCDEVRALEVGERLRRTVEDLALPHAGHEDSPIVTVTVGVAAGRPGRSAHEVLDEAAKAAFATKERQERNRVVLAAR
jgi:diguanylate cyclase (GGDEF)-like protein